MILDKQLLLSDAQVITGTGAVFTTNCIDTWNNVQLTSGALQVPPLAGSGLGMGAVGGQVHDTGRGQDVEIWAQVVVALAGGTSLTIDIGYADDGVGTNFTSVQTSPSVALAAAVAGYTFRLGDIPPSTSQRRMLLGRYNLTGTFTGSGAITCGIVLDRNTAVNLFV